MENEMTPAQFEKFKEAMAINGGPSEPQKIDPNDPPLLDWPKADLHFANVEANLLKYAGKEDHNPYIMMKELDMNKLKRELDRRNITYYQAVMALPLNAVPHVSNLKSLQQD
jgi:hypothetical protein